LFSLILIDVAVYTQSCPTNYIVAKVENKY